MCLYTFIVADKKCERVHTFTGDVWKCRNTSFYMYLILERGREILVMAECLAKLCPMLWENSVFLDI